MNAVRRRMTAFAFLAASATLLAGPSFAQDAATRVVTDDLGYEVTIPADPQRIVVLNYQIASPLIELGANVIGSGGMTNPRVNGGEPYIRGAYHALDFRFENSEIVYLGADRDFDVEAVAAAQPDLIFINTIADVVARRDQLTAIAPTVFIDITGAAGTALERYGRIADFAGQCGAVSCTERYNELSAAFEDRLDKARGIIADTLGDPSNIIVAFLNNVSGNFQTRRHEGVLTEVIDALGFSYPAIVAEAPMVDGNTPGAAVDFNLAPETLPDVMQSDFIVTITRANSSGQTVRETRARFEELFPGWKEFIHAPHNNQQLFIDGEQMEAATFASARYVLDFLMGNIVQRDFVPLNAAP